MSDDSQLLRRYVDEESEAAFAEFVARNIDLVYSAALRQVGGDAHRAKDVAQVVFTTAARKAPMLKDHPVMAGWLYTATHFAAEKLQRGEWRRRMREQEAHAMHELLSSGRADAAVDWDQVRPVLDAAMRELNERDREAVVLRYFARRPFAEIGAALNLSEDAARMRVERALDKLHALLARRGVTSSSAAVAAALSTQAVTAAPAGLAANVCGTALAAASSASGVIGFMTTSKMAAAMAAVVACVSLGSLVYESRASRVATDEWTAANAALELRRAEVRQLAQRAKDEERQAEALLAQVAETRAQLAIAGRAMQVAAGVPGEKDPAQNPVEVGNAFLATHPGVKEALVQRSRARVAARFQPMYAKLGFSPEQIEKFEMLMIENEGISTGDEKSSMILRPGAGMSRADVDAALREMLGEGGYQIYRDTGSKSGLKTTTTMLAANLYFTDTPLTPTQAEQVVEIMGDMKGPHAWDSLIERAGTVLSPPQIEALRGMQIEENFNRAMSEGMKRWMSETVNAADAAKKGGGK